MKIDSIICVLGWEQRFLSGMKILLQKHEIKTLFLISFIDYKSMKGMEQNKSAIENLALKHKINIEPIELNYSDSIGNWKKLDAYFDENELGSEVMINTTTFPRETIWTLLFFLKQKLQFVHYVYFKPEKYDKDWLTRNHGNPRLLFKHSGVFDLNQQLALFVITGFDSNRLDTMLEFYEPNKIVLFCQNGEQFDNLLRNKGLSQESIIKVKKVMINTYDIMDATKIINTEINEHKDSNIIITSQGPKTSAISTYKSYLVSDNRVALAYVPAKDFSHNYSLGIDPNPIKGELEFS